MVITKKKKLTVNIHKIKRRKSKPTITEYHQFTKEDCKRGRKEQRNHKRARKQLINNIALVSPSLSIIKV